MDMFHRDQRTYRDPFPLAVSILARMGLVVITVYMYFVGGGSGEGSWETRSSWQIQKFTKK